MSIHTYNSIKYGNDESRIVGAQTTIETQNLRHSSERQEDEGEDARWVGKLKRSPECPRVEE